MSQTSNQGGLCKARGAGGVDLSSKQGRGRAAEATGGRRPREGPPSAGRPGVSIKAILEGRLAGPLTVDGGVSRRAGGG